MASVCIVEVPSVPIFPTQFTLETQPALNHSRLEPLPTRIEACADERYTPVLVAWDADIKSAARAAATRFRLDQSYADDFAQDARIRLLKILRQHPTVPPEGYLRRVISNAIQSAVSATRSSSGTDCIDQVTDDLEAANIGTNGASSDPLRVVAVADFIHSLPVNLRRVYELIYELGHTQREAALHLGVTQPRVTQMHKELLCRARHELGPLQNGAEFRAA